jgi:amino acid adenylation domain-containing protein
MLWVEGTSNRPQWRPVFTLLSVDALCGRIGGVSPERVWLARHLFRIESKEKNLVAKEFNETARAFPDDECLPDLLREQVRVRPDSVAVVFDEESLTYRELAGRSAELAACLRHLGVSPDDCVGIFVEPSIDLMVGAWGILFSGGAYVPMSPEYPEERLRYMIEDARAGVIFTQEKLRDRLAELAPDGTKIVTPKDAAQFARSAAAPLEGESPAGPRPDSLAYVIYTSGSTGKPKGVMIEHRSIVNQMHWMREVQGLGPDKVVLHKTPMSFDAAQWEILSPVCGSRVVMGRPGVYRDPEGLLETITKHDVTTVQCVPTLLQALVDTGELSTCKSLTQIFSGGEALSKNLASRCAEELPWCGLVNLYGPTECTINASSFTVDQDTVDDGPSAIPIGTPVYNTRFHILAEDRSPVAVGEIGELHIGGVQLARGYLHRPELTAERFIADPFIPDQPDARLYKTGDLAYRNPDGTVQFVGRADNQVKLRGFRVELDEIRLAIETHDWVKNAAVVVREDSRTGFQNLIACIELSPREAALMDQGNHGSHHQSKESKLQVKAQLSNPGCRDVEEIAGKKAVDLPGAESTGEQRRRVFARKTYRFFEGGEVTAADILRLLEDRRAVAGSRTAAEVGFAEFGEILRYFGQYLSAERLLPKYGYASPGALYATQMYLELDGIGELEPGYYYYHPVRHQLILIKGKSGAGLARARIHFVGKNRAIEPVYKNNIQEVLEIETGHMVGLFEEVLPAYGLDIRPAGFEPAEKDNLECAQDDYYLGTFELVPSDTPPGDDISEIYVQTHPERVEDLPAGQYRYRDGELAIVSDDLVQKKDVIAINQQVYERASLGITVISRPAEAWLAYVELGRKMQRLQMKDVGLGFMSSGYSSKTGNDLQAAKRVRRILNSSDADGSAVYFFVGGRVSDEQWLSEGMKEDTVHMRGPAEMIRDDLVNFLPDYMLPNRVMVLNELPLTANGKIDHKSLAVLVEANTQFVDRPFIPPRTRTERRIGEIWKSAMKADAVSVQDNFFECGGNSLIAVALINRINKEFGSALPLQVLFESTTVEKLAQRVDDETGEPLSRLVPLQPEGQGRPVHCWPGLGGYTMNLRLLAGKMGTDQPFYGVQAHGINEGETPYPTIREMALRDVEAIRLLQPEGPYTLWGYSFGARVAFEAAYQLEQSGERVENLFLIAPGSPKVRAADGSAYGTESAYSNKGYVTILFSVFAGSITDPALQDCLRVAKDEESFASFISEFKNLDIDLVKRIADIVRQTYEFEYTFRELADRRLSAPVTIFKAQGDDYSFIENSSGYSSQAPAVIELEADHYSILKEPDIDELVDNLRRRHLSKPQEIIMPHVNIKHFPVALSQEQESAFVAAVTEAVKNAFGCNEGVISIALEPVEENVWNERVYIPEIVNRRDLLRKTPNY